MRALLLLAGLLCFPALAEIAGSFENDADGVTYLSTEQGRCPVGMRLVAAANKENALLLTGCYGIHNGLSVVIMWARGPAVVIPVASIAWKEQTTPSPKLDSGT